MSKTQSIAATPAAATRPAPQPTHRFSQLRCLAWHGTTLLASQGYTLLSADLSCPDPQWRVVAFYRPPWWRNVSASLRLSYRLFSDGFGALVAVASGHVAASVPGGIVSLAAGETEFHITHDIGASSPAPRMVATSGGKIFWSGHRQIGGRRQCCIYTSPDRGLTWEVAQVFPAAVTEIRSLVHDPWDDCIWILAEQDGGCVLRAPLDFRVVDAALSGVDARMAACVPTRDAIYFGSCNPGQQNHVFRFRRGGSLIKVASLGGCASSACQVGTSMFFSTTPDPNQRGEKMVVVYRSHDGEYWEDFLHWKKDIWPPAFQRGCAHLSSGQNATNLLAVSTVAVSGDDLHTTLWRI